MSAPWIATGLAVRTRSANTENGRGRENWVGSFESEDQARRVAACWNSLAGIPTEDLERYGYSLIEKMRKDEAQNVVKQRDSLLKSITHARDCLASGVLDKDNALDAFNHVIAEVNRS